MAGKNYDINFRIQTDAKPTRKELEMTVAEFRDFNKTVKASQTPLDKFEKDLSDLNKAFKAGGITADQYEHRLKDIENRYSRATTQQKKFKTGLNQLTTSFKNMAASYVAFSTVQKGLRLVREEMERIDRFAKQAAGLGTTTEFLSGLEFVAQRTSGLAAGAASKGIEKMTKRLAEAATGTGEAVKALEMLGLEAKALEKLNPSLQFEILSRAMDQVTDAGQRTLIATKLFDIKQSKLHTTMALTNKEYQNQIDLAKELGQVITKAEGDKAEAYIDSIQRRDAALAKATKSMAMNQAFFNPLSAERQTERSNTLADFMSSEKGLGDKAGMAAKEGLQFLPLVQLGKLIKYGFSGSSGVSAEGRDLSSRTLSQSEVIALEKKNADDKAKLEQEAFNKLWAESAEKKKKVDFYQANEAAKHLGFKLKESFNRLGDFQLGSRRSALGGLLGRGIAGLAGMAPGSEFEKVVSDPMESIASNSSEAFRLQNQQTSMLKVEKDDEKKTQKNTKKTADNTGSIYDLLANATGIGL